jgi:hypothetical protein
VCVLKVGNVGTSLVCLENLIPCAYTSLSMGNLEKQGLSKRRHRRWKWMAFAKGKIIVVHGMRCSSFSYRSANLIFQSMQTSISTTLPKVLTSLEEPPLGCCVSSA